MLGRTWRGRGFVPAAVLCLLFSGCGKGPEAEFSLRTATEELIPDAQRSVRNALKEGFGTPQHLVAWQKMPVDYGGVVGTVVSVAEGKVHATWDGDAKLVSSGAPVVWLSGARAEARAKAEAAVQAKKQELASATEGTTQLRKELAELEAKASQLSVDGLASAQAEQGDVTFSATEPAVAEGDKFVVAFGKGLQTGRVVYMKNCMHCHGVAGDGAGPTAQYLNPLPRDYRLGVFKFKSTLNPEKPTRDDLSRIVKYGIPGTYMPSFLWLGDDETKAVVEYVRWLAMRGEYEKRITDDLSNDFSQKQIEESAAKARQAYDTAKADEKPERPKSAGQLKSEAAEAFRTYDKEDLPDVLDGSATSVADSWALAETPEVLVFPSVARVTDDAASRERGRRLYQSDKGKCYTCHGPHGRGDGTSTEEFWKVEGTSEFYPRRGLHDKWGNPLQPRNLTLGQYRGGRRPIDVFRRIYAGIAGTPMPAFGKTAMTDEEIWDVVNYVMSLQYQKSPAKASHSTSEHATASK